MRNVSNKRRRENQSSKFKFHIVFPKILPFMRMSKNVVEPERPQVAIWRSAECWIIKATRVHPRASARAPTDTHIHACASGQTHTHAFARAPTEICKTFPRQQWFRKGASILRYTYIDSIVSLPFRSTNTMRNRTRETERTICCGSYLNFNFTFGRLN
jgi:hypothetical protein